MSDFVILTDSSADLGADMVRELDVQVLPLSFILDEHTYQNHPDNREMDPHVFYERLRGGDVATTNAVNVAQYTEALEPLLQAGRDVLILAFSSGLSTTYNSSRLAVEELSAKYPERKLFTVDTLCASLGQGLLVWYAAKARERGCSIEEVRDWVEDHKLNLCHQFTVDDLHFLKRGGRISAATAMVGSMLHIKPVLHVDDEGHLTSIGKVRGRHASLKALVDQMEETAVDSGSLTVFISHGDCLEDAQAVERMVRDRFNVHNIYINFVGPVIGAHSGPGTVALFYIGTVR
ncbi:DegV family protein [Colidextribacter sp. OB.20]|uniref:DegV family protein n=1 Tax=Colidextribacter sp. OB.20 TaxID=2304568 RepID=UPI00136AD386|nr:DegV family protein [Colidextribacter sp. OB.20]NBI10746.1 DegV family protein [Colidextribacter sp. OB.20]